MKRYMSRAQRLGFVTFSTLLGYVHRTFLPEWKERKYLTEEEIKKTEDSVNALLEVSDSVIGRMDGDFRRTLQKDMNGLDVFTLPKHQAKIKVDEYYKNDEMVYVARYVLDNIAGVSLELCSKCFKTIEQQGDCTLKACYLACGIEPINPDAEEGCPFNMEKFATSHEFLRDYLKKLFEELKEKNAVLKIEDSSGYSIDSSKKAHEER